MKKNITLTILLLFSYFGFSQKVIYNKISDSRTFSEYQTKEGSILKINDTIRINYPLGSDFTFITQGNLHAASFLSNTKVVIYKIKSVGTKTRGYKVYVLFKGYGLPVYIDYEAALETGEIKNPFTQ